MDQDYSNFDSILHHVDALRSKWSGLGEKYKSLQFSFNEAKALLEETRAELESNKMRALKAENDRDNMMHILKELYKEKRLTNPFNESLNKLERIILATQNNIKPKNHSFESIIDDIPSTLAKSIVISDSSNDNKQHRSVDSVPFKNEIIGTSNDSNLNQDDRPLIANEDTSVSQNCTSSAPLIYSDQRQLSNNIFGPYTNAEHGLVAKNESYYEFIDSEREPDFSEVIVQNDQEDIDPLSVSDKVDRIRKPIQNKPVHLLEKDDNQQAAYRTKIWDVKEVKVTLPRIDVSNVLLKKCESNDDASADIQEVYSSSIRLKKYESCLFSPPKLPDESDELSSWLFEDDVQYKRARRCTICKKQNSESTAYCTYQDLDDHISKNHPQPYPAYRRCPYGEGKCRRHFAELRDLQKHIKLRHQYEISYTIGPTHELSGYMSKRCLICNETFVNLLDLKKHINQVHNEASEPLKCQICGLVLPTMRGLHKHRCQKRCDRKVTKKSSTSLDSSRFTGCYIKCRICMKETPRNEALYNRRDLNIHILQSHSNSYPEYVRCPHQNAKCKSHFTSISSYRAHVGVHHREEDLYIPLEKFFPGLKTLSCSVCGKQFLSRYHLERHSLVFCKQANKTTIALRKRH